jgi:leukotriene-A4 hydrolase
MVRVLGWLIFLGLFMPVLASTAAPDPHSFANFQQVRTRHLVLDLAVDFTRQQLTGFAEHQLERAGQPTPEDHHGDIHQ